MNEEKIIAIYEQVAIQAITPNEARKQFLDLVKDDREKLIQKMKDSYYPVDLEEGDKEVQGWNKAIRQFIAMLQDENV